jgi:hypothetical protein
MRSPPPWLDCLKVEHTTDRITASHAAAPAGTRPRGRPRLGGRSSEGMKTSGKQRVLRDNVARLSVCDDPARARRARGGWLTAWSDIGLW